MNKFWKDSIKTILLIFSVMFVTFVFLVGFLYIFSQLLKVIF